MKRFLFLTILFFSIPSLAHGATEFVSIVDTGGATDADYSTLNSWESAIGTNLTAPSTIVFSGIVTGTAPADGSQVTLYRSGASQGVGATVVHTAKTNTQILLKNVSDLSFSWASGDQWRIDASNYFQIDDVTHDQPQVTAKCRATTGAADTTAVTISGWDTDSTHYIKIWTDPSENYRHQGKYDISKYRMEVSSNNYPIYIQEEYAKMDGLQISLSNSSNNNLLAVRITPTGTSEIQISNNIVRGILSGSITGNSGISVTGSENQVTKIYNNIAYGFSLNTTGNGIYINAGTAYVYNNTVLNNYRGISSSSGTTIAKNNISYNNTDNYYLSPEVSTNNLSGPGSDAQLASTSAPQNGVTVTFADEYNNDFHLDSSDTGAKNNGTILYDSGDDANLYFTTDADNESRKDVAGSWDIGADENVAKIYRSVGVGATTALASGGTADSSYGNMEIKPTYLNVGSTANLTDYIATFWRPLPDNVGVGDALQYDADNTGGIDNIVFITERIDSTHYSVRKSDGTAPTSTSSVPNNTWSIYRSYISLSNGIAQTENTGISAGVQNFDTSKNLSTNNLQWNFACFANGTAPDSTAVSISGWTTTADNYIRIYTPIRTDEVGTSQRHTGKWDDTKYKMEVTDGTVISIGVSTGNGYIYLDGLQMLSKSPTVNGRSGIYLTANIDTNNYVYISNNIIKGDNSNSYYQRGINAVTNLANFKAWNNVIYDIYPINGNSGGIVLDQVANAYAYNNTIYGAYFGFYLGSGNEVLKNNIVQSSTIGYSGSFNSSSTNNLSDRADAPGSNPQNSKTVSFADSTNKDFHLGVGDTVARNIGTDLTNDPYLPIQTDIDSTGSTDGKSCDAVYQDQCLTRPRSTSWDIGADELITKIYRSVGVGTTAAIISGTSPAISLTISGNTGTFSTFPTSSDFGVGDVIRYDSDNNGTVDSTAFISAIDSTAKTATLQTSTGGTPTATSAADYDWKLYRAYTSLSDWESGTENTGIGVTYDAGNRDIATNSEQWNVACYANSGTAPDTTAVSISGWTTKLQNYIKVYTPTSSSEVTTSQKHQGKWDDTKYNITVTNNGDIYISDNYIRVDGLQLKIIASSGVIQAFVINTLTARDNRINISNNIFSSVSTGSTDMDGINSNSANNNIYIWNNILYDFVDISIRTLSNTAYVYNNTVTCSNSGYCVGIHTSTSYNTVAKNNIVKGAGNTYAYFTAGAFSPETDYNATDGTDTTGQGIHSKISQTFSFIDSANRDYHLSPIDTAAKDAGTDLSKDLYLPITSDIDSQSRNSNFKLKISNSQYDIGADQSANAIYRSLAPSATSSIASGTSPANSMIIAGTSVTFGTAPGDTVGVGDAIQYDSDNNGTVDSIAFISGRTSGTVYTIQDRTGGTPTSTSATDYDWAIYRAYTSLQNASGSTSGGTENTGLADAIEHFDIGWSAAHGKDIYKYNQQWNIAAYANSTTADSTLTTISGWTTYSTNYLKVYTPTATTEVGTSQRHQGKWDSSKYYMSVSLAWTHAPIIILNPNVRIDGLQLSQSATNNSNAYGLRYQPTTGTGELVISNCILKGMTSSNYYNFGIGIMNGNGTSKIYNNIIYDFVGLNNSGSGIYFGSSASNMKNYVYNNTVSSSELAYYAGTGQIIAKNNIAQSCNHPNGCYYGTFDSSSDYNISNIDASDAPNATFTNDYANVTFADSSNKDFHLAASDTAARNAGADLSADAYLPITTDIDGHTRPTGTNVVDIGADEGATAVYYSVGQSTSTDFKVASNISVSGYTATFTTAQTGNMGVGDIVTYDGGSCYITGKTSTTVWNCQNATGGTAPQVSGVSVTSIKRAFASLNSSISGSTAPTFLNTSDLKTNNYILNIPCYMDSGTTPDTTAVTIQGYTTAVPNYIKVYTPNNTTTEANQSQRHQGKWTSTAYTLAITVTKAINISNSNVKIDGIQIDNTSALTNGIVSYNDRTEVANCILRNMQGGISFSSASFNNAYNNIVYGTTTYGIAMTNSHNGYFYNNTLSGNAIGFYKICATDVYVKNSLFSGNTTDYSSGGCSTDPSFTYNSTNQSSGIPSGTGNRYSQTFTFQDATNYDYHLAQTDAGAKNYGTPLSSDSYFAFTTDIDGNTRNVDSRGWDIGADETATPIYYSVGQSSSDLKTGSPTLSIDSSGNGTLSVSQTGNMGVGDYIEYGTSPYNKAYITGKTSSTVWTVQAANGTMLGVSTTEPVNSIKHAYTTLNGAIAGASGATMMNTTDLYANNYQLNIPCYYDNAADTTTASIFGYTTYSKNYIKVYTPTNTSTEANNSQRHSGKWDEGRYRLEVTNGSGIGIYSAYTIIDGLQIKISLTSSSYNYNVGMMFYSLGTGKEVTVSNNILKGNMSGTTSISDGIRFLWAGRGIGKVYNNVIYNFSNPGYVGFVGIVEDGGGEWINYWYNNTVYNNYNGFYSGSSAIYKNNIAYNNSDNYSGSYSSSCTNNLSGPTQTDAPGSNPQNGKTVNFVDSANYDFHLAESDTSARNAGATLTSDLYLPTTTDIDGNSRPAQNAFDIGADEGSTYIYYSVGQNTADHKTGSPTITLSGYQATLSVGQTAPNMGVGDLITYTGGSCYITKKTNDDKMHWNCQNATGGTAPQVSGVSVTSITHVFSSLNSGINNAHEAAYLNATNLYSGNYTLNIPCYYDTGPDTAGVMFDDYTTGASNYIRIYTPTNTATEVNQSQRHRGKWDTERYRLETGDYYKFDARTNYVRIDGLQIKNNDPNARGTQALTLYTASYATGNASLFVSNNIIWGNASQPTSYYGIALSLGVRQTAYIWNNIVYGFNYNNMGFGIAVMHYNTPNSTAYVYNNTVYDCYRGIHSDSLQGLDSIKNNLSYNNNEYYYNRNGISFSSSSVNNLLGGTTPSEGAFGASADSGTTTGSATNKLIQTGQNFTQTVKVGMIVKNTTDTTYSYVTAIDSDTQLTLNDNIMSSSEAFTIYTNRYGTVAFEGANDDNFHLSNSDTLAKNNGVRLATYSDDSNLNFTTDIDGNPRTGNWSIGADDGPFVEAQSSQNIDTNESINSGLAGYWSFDGDDVNIGGTAAYDKSGNGNTGTISGATAAIGKLGQGMSFDANDDYISTGTASSLGNLSPMSISIWAKAKSYGEGGQGYIATKTGSCCGIDGGWVFKGFITYQSIFFGVDYDGTSNLYAYSANNSFTSSDFGKWVHWTITWDGTANASGIHFYKDGVEISKGITSDGDGNRVSDISQNITIGSDDVGGSRTFDGSLDEMRIYNRALSADEIGRLYKMGQVTTNSSQEGKYTNGLVGHWTFDGDNMTGVGIGATALDSSGNNNFGILSGTAPGPTQAIGKLGQGINFNGANNQIISINDSPSLSPTSAVTMVSWFKTTMSMSVYTRVLISKDNAYGLSLNQGSSHRYVGMSIRQNSASDSFQTTTPSAYNDGKWHQLVGVFDGDFIKLYFDGAYLDSKDTTKTGIDDSNYAVLLGYAYASGYYFNGSLDDVRIYNRALSAEEIGDLYRAGQATVKK